MFRKSAPVYSKKSKKINSNENPFENPFEKIQSLMCPPEVEKEHNEIYFFTDVTQETCHDLCRKINDMNKELLKFSIQYNCAPPNIYLYINSL